MSGHVTTQGRRPAEVLPALQVLVRERFGIQHATLQIATLDHVDDGACCRPDPRCAVLETRPC